MRLIKKREQLEVGRLIAVSFASVFPLIGLITGTAYMVGAYGMNYSEVSLVDDPEQYWEWINFQCYCVILLIFLSKFEFPFYSKTHKALDQSKEANKYVYYLILFIAIPMLLILLFGVGIWFFS